MASGHCQAVTTGLWVSAVLSRLGFKQAAKYGWVRAGILQKWQTALRVKGLHSAEEECKSFLTALHARMTCTNHVRSVTSFNAVTWKTHVRIVKPLRLEKSALPLTFSHKHHGLFGFIVSLLISIATCAYVLLSWYALRGEALRPPPCTPSPAFIF